MLKEDQIKTIIDNDFLDTDVSELVTGDIYLFHLTDTHVYLYQDGLIGAKAINDKEDDVELIEYKSGTLREYVSRI